MKSEIAQLGNRSSLAEREEYRELVAGKRRFVGIATALFVTSYFTLLLSVCYLPELMSVPLVYSLNAAYLFALFQFLMVFLITWLYCARAARWDKLVELLRHDRPGDETDANTWD